jgi:phosphonopyruvate decarboxylase
MISPQALYESLKKEGVEFFSGVPDSLLKEFCQYLESTLPPSKHVISVNEGTAVALAAGSYLGTGRVPLVYLQNSGLGNLINPTLSLADPEVYGLPMIFMIGWRGEPGKKDEPQHIKQGRITTDMLSSMELPWRIVNERELNDGQESVKWAVQTSKKINGPVVLLIKKNVFLKLEDNNSATIDPEDKISREEVINIVSNSLREDTMVVATTGMISRELYEVREIDDMDHSKDFLTVGSMGHASQIALGISLSNPQQDITCLDGDGSLLMHMGGMATIGCRTETNLFHIILNNGAHDSVGGQATVALKVCLTDIARGCGYDKVEGPLKDASEIKDTVRSLSQLSGNRFLEIQVRKGSRKNLGRPKETPIYNKDLFIKSLRGKNE